MESHPNPGPRHEPDRLYERASDPAEAADRPLEPKSSTEELAARDEPRPADEHDPHHGSTRRSARRIPTPTPTRIAPRRPTTTPTAPRACGAAGSAPTAEVKSPQPPIARRCGNTEGMRAVDQTGGMPFESPYAHGFVRVAAAVPRVRVGDPRFNGARTVELAQRAHEEHAALVIFPELGLAAYSSEDLFHQGALLDAVTGAIHEIVRASEALRPGDRRRRAGVRPRAGCSTRRWSSTAAGSSARSPRATSPSTTSTTRSASSAPRATSSATSCTCSARRVPFTPDLVFACRDVPEFVLGVEICEDLWTPVPPSTYAALAGATVLANLSASNITIGKDGYRRMLCEAQSGRTISGYVYTAAGLGESTTDMAWDGQALIYENGQLLHESRALLRRAGADPRRPRPRPDPV